jgi:hypothetical protein
MADAILALAGVLFYATVWYPAFALCADPDASKDQGVLRVCRRRLFRYTSRMGLKTLLCVYCMLRAQMVWERVDPPIAPEQWAGPLVILAVLVWLTVDTTVSRHYD